jgi:hypothetical protein
MAEEIQQDEGKGLSRRQMIKASAVAGAAAWTAPMIIDSLASPAAAASVPGSVACSKDIVFFTIPTDPGTVYITGYQNSCVGCGCFGNWSASNLAPNGFRCFTCGSVTYRVNPGLNNAATGATCAGATTAAVPMTSATCNNWLTVTNGNVTGINGAVVLAAIAFEGNVVYGFCPSGNTISFGNCIGSPTT